MKHNESIKLAEKFVDNLRQHAVSEVGSDGAYPFMTGYMTSVLSQLLETMSEERAKKLLGKFAQ